MRINVGLLVLAVVVVVTLFSQSNTSTQAANTISATYEVINIGGTTDGLPPNASAGTNANTKYVSADGNVVLFTSLATNLPNATNRSGLYAYNIKENNVVRVDVSTSGIPSNFVLTSGMTLSETGRYVTFASRGTNLIDGTTTPSNDIGVYQRDIQTGTTVSLFSRGGSSTSSSSWDRHLGVSNDGRFTLFASRYVQNSYPYPYNVVYADNKTGTPAWTTVGIGNDGESNPGASGYTDIDGQMSCDGSLVAYQHQGTIRLLDVRNNSSSDISLASASSINPVISCNGRYILYTTINRTDITPTPTGMNAKFHLVRYDRITGLRSYIDSNSSGVFSPSVSEGPSLNANYFEASVADTGDVVFLYKDNKFLKHLSDGSGTLEPIAKNISGATVKVLNGVISSDGRYIMFNADPYSLGLVSSPAGTQLIRVKTGL